MTARWNQNFIMAFGLSHAIDYPSPVNLSYFWGFGFNALMMLVVQILTGVFLAMH
jgi:ubiquinol-cytochrome c reductase cytochrome b subunit